MKPKTNPKKATRDVKIIVARTPSDSEQDCVDLGMTVSMHPSSPRKSTPNDEQTFAFKHHSKLH